jgi:hypothetical protein
VEYFINLSHQSVSVCILMSLLETSLESLDYGRRGSAALYVFARQQLGKHVI